MKVGGIRVETELRNAQLSKRSVVFYYCSSIGGFWIECKISEAVNKAFSQHLLAHPLMQAWKMLSGSEGQTSMHFDKTSSVQPPPLRLLDFG